MPRSFARYEQFLRILTLLDILSNAHAPLDDQSLIATLKDRLGLSRLSSRTLHRDCEFLVTCGYPIDHSALPGNRRYGWRLDKAALAGRKIPSEPITILEMASFTICRELMRPFEGTILWTGIEGLRSKLERNLPAEFLAQAAEARRVFRVVPPKAAGYAERPRILSAITTAIDGSHEIEIEEKAAGPAAPPPRRLQPAMLLIDPPRIRLAAWEAPASPPGKAADDPLVIIELEQIARVKRLDATFVPKPLDEADLDLG